MHDREFLKPKPVTLIDPDGNDRGRYSFEAYLSEFVWSYPKWDQDEAWGEAQIRIGAAVRACKPGAMVALLRAEDGEKLREANSAAQIRGPFADQIRPLNLAVRRMAPPSATADANGHVVTLRPEFGPAQGS